MVGQAQRPVARDERIFAVPHIADETQAQQNRLREQLQHRVVDKINEMIEIARRERPDLPKIDRSNFSLTIPNQDVAVVQSAGFIFTANMRDGTISVYGRDSKVMMG
ncbi:hypothetical protein H0O01_03445 [Candidatus Micrarchaeota archaeon]|nr:hypothetical protein [Candidatus Micrarchaeota archaeon]